MTERRSNATMAARASTANGHHAGEPAATGGGLTNANPDDLGAAIRELRTRHKLRLSDLAASTNLSISFLSQLERGLTNPSLGSLVRVAEALDTTSHELLARLMGGGSSGDGDEFQAEDDGAVISNPGAGYARSLVKGQRAIQPLEMVGGPPEMPEFAVHDTDEFMYVCDGTMEVELAGQGRFLLPPGATIYCTAGTRHRWRQIGDEQLRMLLVMVSSNGAVGREQ